MERKKILVIYKYLCNSRTKCYFYCLVIYSICSIIVRFYTCLEYVYVEKDPAILKYNTVNSGSFHGQGHKIIKDSLNIFPFTGVKCI